MLARCLTPFTPSEVLSVPLLLFRRSRGHPLSIVFDLKKYYLEREDLDLDDLVFGSVLACVSRLATRASSQMSLACRRQVGRRTDVPASDLGDGGENSCHIW